MSKSLHTLLGKKYNIKRTIAAAPLYIFSSCTPVCLHSTAARNLHKACLPHIDKRFDIALVMLPDEKDLVPLLWRAMKQHVPACARRWAMPAHRP